MVQVLLEEVPADPPGADGELAIGQVTDETVDGVPGWRAGVRSWHARIITILADNSKMLLPSLRR
jgi:hypothetical protein